MPMNSSCPPTWLSGPCLQRILFLLGRHTDHLLNSLSAARQLGMVNMSRVEAHDAGGERNNFSAGKGGLLWRLVGNGEVTYA